MLSQKPWRFEKVVLFCAAVFCCLCLGAVAAGVLQQLGVRGFRQPGDFGSILLVTLSFQGVTLPLILLFLREHQVGWREAFGWRGPRLKSALLLALMVTIVILPVAWGLQIGSDQVLTKPGEKPDTQVAVQLLQNTKSVWLSAYIVVFAVGVAPVAEEFIFRGMLYPFVKQLGFPRLAWIGLSLLFALIHLNAIAFVPLFTLSIALTWLYEKTDNLLAPVTVHALFNAANAAALFLSRSAVSPAPQ